MHVRFMGIQHPKELVILNQKFKFLFKTKFRVEWPF